MEPTHKLYKPACRLVKAIEHVLAVNKLPEYTKIEIIDEQDAEGRAELHLMFHTTHGYNEYIKMQKNLIVNTFEYDGRRVTERIDEDYSYGITIAVGMPFINWLWDAVELNEEISLTELTDQLPTSRQIAIDTILNDLA